jgi:hypothetical protein
MRQQRAEEIQSDQRPKQRQGEGEAAMREDDGRYGFRQQPGFRDQQQPTEGAEGDRY